VSLVGRALTHEETVTAGCHRGDDAERVARHA
jgi:hypothetical protein